jgi:geranylgeranyl pyrophosphate synthase
MIGGQADDIAAAGKRIDETALIEMHRGKTGALIAAALQFGAVIGKAPLGTTALLETLGLQIGLAFQFLDDLLDATSSKEALGKNVKRDAALQKPTAAAFYGIEGVQKRLAQFRDSIQQLLGSLPNGALSIQNLLYQNLWSRLPANHT